MATIFHNDIFYRVHKLVVVGGGGVGKSSLVLRFIKDTFVDEGYNPTIEDHYRRQAHIDNEHCFLDIIDTAGQEEYRPMDSAQIPTGDGFILVYSIASRASFDEIPALHAALLAHTKRDAIPAVIVGHKCDLENIRQVPTSEGRLLAKHLNARFLEASAKTAFNADDPFSSVVREIRRHRQEAARKKEIEEAQETEGNDTGKRAGSEKGKAKGKVGGRWRLGRTRPDFDVLVSEIHPEPRTGCCAGCVVM